MAAQPGSWHRKFIAWLRRLPPSGAVGSAGAARSGSAASAARSSVAGVGGVVDAASGTARQTNRRTPVEERTQLGRYRIERRIGRGAMGAVFLAFDPQGARPVALKTLALKSGFEGDSLAAARASFFREAAMAGRLAHRDIVSIFDAGEEDDLAYIAMEYVRGRDLLQHTLPPKLLPVEVVVETCARVAEALAYAHTRGIVHRDVKPANIMIDEASGTVKITDFGIARITDASRTRTGQVLGTPSFMSPEQLAGQTVDGRTDLYSLGVTLFQLLTGALPHDSEVMATLLYQIANAPARDVRELRPELPATLAATIARALEKRPELRHADGIEMAAELRAVPLA